MALPKEWLVEHILHADQASIDTVLKPAGNCILPAPARRQRGPFLTQVNGGV